MTHRYFSVLLTALAVAGLVAASPAVAVGPPAVVVPVTVVPPPASAPPSPLAASPAATVAVTSISPEGASVLSKAIEDQLRDWGPVGNLDAWLWDGPPRVSPAGDHFDVVLPELQINHRTGSRLVVSPIRLAMRPVGDGSWLVEANQAPSITGYAADNKPEADVTAASLRMSGRWLPSFGLLVKADGAIGNLRTSVRGDSSHLEIAGLTFRSDLGEQPAGRWSGPVALELDRLALVDAQGARLVNLNYLAVDGRVRALDLMRAGALEARAVQALKLAVRVKEAPLTPPEPQPPAPPSEHKHLAMLYDLLAAASGRLQIKDLVLTAPGNGGSLGLGNLVLEAKVDGLDQGRSTVSILYDQSGLKLIPAPASPPVIAGAPSGHDFVPEKVKVAVAVADLPNATLWSSFKNAATAEGGREERGLEAAQQMLAALGEAGSQIRIDALEADAPVVAAKLKGTVAFSKSTPLGVQLALEAMMRGFDVAMKQVLPPPGAKLDPDTQTALAMLSMVQAFGAMAKDEAGRDIRSYKIDLGTDGRLSLNGADMTAVVDTVRARLPALLAKAKPAAPPAKQP